MLPHRKRPGYVSYTTHTAVDSKLMEKTGLEEFSLRRLRKEFMNRCAAMGYAEKRALVEGGTCPRFAMMVNLLTEMWPEERWDAWLSFLEHTKEDLQEMSRGEYPISPYLIRVFSALFGIKVDFLLLGAPPSVDTVGVDIDIWPLTGIR